MYVRRWKRYSRLMKIPRCASDWPSRPVPQMDILLPMTDICLPLIHTFTEYAASLTIQSTKRRLYLTEIPRTSIQTFQQQSILYVYASVISNDSLLNRTPPHANSYLPNPALADRDRNPSFFSSFFRNLPALHTPLKTPCPVEVTARCT